MLQEDAIPVLIAILAGSLLVIIISILIKMFLTNPLIVGGYRFFVRNSEEEKPSARLILSEFKNGSFLKVFVTMLLRDIFLFLWSLLLVFPGIIKAYSYRMVPYLLADHPEMSATEIITMSRKMMKGNKWKSFILDLSFILWFILSIITLGIVGILYVNPYVFATNAELYNAIKD